MPSKRTITLLHPGEMGAAVGASASFAGSRVLWVDAGRTAATASRAEAAGLHRSRSLESALAESDTVLSVCPPHAALEVARSIAATGFAGVYLDANAIAPATTREVEQIVAASGARFVDGGIIGSPPAAGGITLLYLAGKESPRIAELFAGTFLQVTTLDGPIGAASALKACYAAWTKGTAALLADILALAEHEGVASALDAEWAASQPELSRSTQRMAANVRKAWRWVGEMEEIAASFETAGLPDGFHRASAEIYSRLQEFKNSARTPDVSAIVEALRGDKARAAGLYFSP